MKSELDDRFDSELGTHDPIKEAACSLHSGKTFILK